MDHITEILGITNDARIRIFRQIITIPGECEAMPVDCYVITTQRFVVICDTLISPHDMAHVMREAQDSLLGRQLLVINSHADWDHAWGNGYFRGAHAAPIIAHTDTRARLQSATALAELQRFQQLVPRLQSVALVPPTLTFSSTLTIDGGDLTLELLAAPGHCAGHSALWLPELRTLLAFDAVEQPIPTLEDAQSVPALRETLKRFQRCCPDLVLCSHSQASPDTIAEHLSYLHELEQRCRHFLATHPMPIVTEERPYLTTLLQFPFEAIDTTNGSGADFYREVHEHNVRCTLRWVAQTNSPLQGTTT